MPSLEQYLMELDEGLQQQGHAPLDEASLREVAKHLNHPEVMQQLQSGQLTTQQLVQEVGHAMGAMRGPRQTPTQVPSFAMEGGLVNDRTGQESALLKQRGYQVRP